MMPRALSQQDQSEKKKDQDRQADDRWLTAAATRLREIKWEEESLEGGADGGRMGEKGGERKAVKMGIRPFLWLRWVPDKC